MESDYIKSIREALTQTDDSVEYSDILVRKCFDINIRLFQSYDPYKKLILQTSQYLENLLSGGSFLGISGANIGVPFNIIAFRQDGLSRTLINPKIIKQSNKYTEFLQSCGSIKLPAFLDVFIPEWVEVEYYDIDGKKNSEVFKGWITSIVCHEIDHNNGVLMTDRKDEKIWSIKIHK